MTLTDSKGRSKEAWMKTSGGGQQFLVTESERATMQAGGGGSGSVPTMSAMPVPPATAPAAVPAFQPEIGGPQMSVSTPGHGMMGRPVTAPVMGGIDMSQSVMMSPGRSMQPQMFSAMGQHGG